MTASAASFAKATLKTLEKKDDGDKAAYWRVEDAGSKISTVAPSETRKLVLP